MVMLFETLKIVALPENQLVFLIKILLKYAEVKGLLLVVLNGVMQTNYYDRSEVSNSDLTWLKNYFEPQEVQYDLERIFAFGSLIDAMITENHKVDYFKLTCEGYQHTAEEFEQAREMKKAFMRDAFCANMMKHCSFQHVTVKEDFQIEYDGFEFSLPARCKWDCFVKHFDLSGDIKSTACTTQKQFEESIYFFEYDRSRAWYMDLEERSNDIVIGISKENFKVFKVPVKRGGAIYNSGKAKYQELAFMWKTLFGETKIAA